MSKIYELYKTPKDRFWSKVNRADDDSCWIWLGAKSNKGYGNFRIRSNQVLAHRYSYQIFKGEIPSGLLVCHKCDNPSCVNPNHLFLGTHLDNEMDKKNKNRQAKGEKNGQAGKKNWKNVLNVSDVLYIRSSDKRVCVLAKEFKVTDATICDIKSRRSWGWL